MTSATENVGCLWVPTATITSSRSPPGQDLCVGGFMGALQGALICASAVLKRNLYADAVRLKKCMEAAEAKKRD